MDERTKYWILLGISKNSSKKGKDIIELYRDRPDFIKLGLGKFFEDLRTLEKKKLIKQDAKSLSPRFTITKNGEKELRKPTPNDQLFNQVIKCFPEIELRKRIENIEAFAFGVALLFASYIAIKNEVVQNPNLSFIILGLFLFSLVFAGIYLMQITTLVVDKFKISILNSVLDFFEDNKDWLGYGTIAVLTILGVYSLKKYFNFSDIQIGGAIILEIILLLIINSRKINNYIKSINLLKEKE